MTERENPSPWEKDSVLAGPEVAYQVKTFKDVVVFLWEVHDLGRMKTVASMALGSC